MHRILVVDDEPQVRDLCRLILEGAGYTVRTARHGAEALRLLAAEPADLVICDIFMPEMEGLETISELKRRGLETRILAISGGAGGLPNFLATAQRFGAVSTLQKPFSRDELLAAVQTALPDAAEA